MRQFIQWAEAKLRQLLEYVYQYMYSNKVIDVTLINFNAKWIERIQLYHNKITQVMIDKLFTDLIASGLGSSVTGTKTIILTQIEGGIAPSSAIQTQLRTLGYTIKIN